jgi:hypothetical protein
MKALCVSGAVLAVLAMATGPALAQVGAVRVDPRTGLPVTLPKNPPASQPTVDPRTGRPALLSVNPRPSQPVVDPRTGLPLNIPLAVDPHTRMPQWTDPVTGLPTDRRTGVRFHPQSGLPIDPREEVAVDPRTGGLVDLRTGQPYHPTPETLTPQESEKATQQGTSPTGSQLSGTR